MKHNRYLLIPVLLLLTFSSSAANACSCSNDHWTPTQYLEASDFALTGVVLSLTPDPGDPTDDFDDRIALEINRTGCWKGETPPTLVIYTPATDGLCRYPFEVGTEYAVFAAEGTLGTLNLGEIGTTVCSGNQPLEFADSILEELGPPATDCALAIEPTSWSTLKRRYP